MNNKKEQERDELHKTIWKIANELRGSVDGWDFKQYVLGLLFYRFISENIENYVNGNQIKAGQVNFKYSELSDEDALNGKSQILEEKGFFILPSELFFNVRKNAKNNENLNVVIANVFDNIESSARGTASEDDVKGLFDDFDVRGNKLGNTVEERNNKLVKMIDAIGDLKLGDYQDNSIDTFGDAYEFLMTMYASNAGKSGGEFFTPQEVGELLARICIGDKTSVNKVYDPCCGSGGLLLKFAKILGKENVKQGFYGQEVNLTTYNLARINMFLHDINYNNFNLAREDTLIHPEHWDDEPFDAIVSNPPYSIHWAGKSNPILINDERFSPAGVLAPESKADLAFTMHMLSWLSSKGTAAIVEFPGVLYRGGAEQKIRKYMIDNNFVDTIIQLPSDLFFGTSIATCILVLKKNKTDNNILFVDASEECIRNTNKNKLSQDNIDNIINLLKSRVSVEYKSYLATYEEVKENDYNISVNSYLKSKDTNPEIDIKEVNRKLAEIVPREEKIRKELEEIIRDLESDYYE
jgi:type I restriction enzyme M protein